MNRLSESSAKISNPPSFPVPPMLLAQSKLPEASSLLIKISSPPAEVRLNVPAPGSKSTVPANCPVVNTFPELSVDIEFPLSSWDPPILLAHKKSPLPSNLLMKTSSNPAPVRLNVPGPGSKSTVPLNRPVVNTLPTRSIVISYP